MCGGETHEFDGKSALSLISAPITLKLIWSALLSTNFLLENV
jgi:hypothetical protein